MSNLKNNRLWQGQADFVNVPSPKSLGLRRVQNGPPGGRIPHHFYAPADLVLSRQYQNGAGRDLGDGALVTMNFFSSATNCNTNNIEN
jgi:hypothetical protein